jgi:hypothetical protein
MATNDEAIRDVVVIDQRVVRLDEEGNEVVAVRLSTGAIYVPIRPLCATLGLEASGQIQRIRRREALAEMLRTIPIPTAGGTQDLACIHVEAVPLWLSGVDTARVKEELRAKLVDFQRWARSRIAEAFLAEAGIGPLLGPAPMTTPTATEGSPLDQIEAFGLALTAFARQQRAFEMRYTTDQEVVQGTLAHLDREVTRLDTRLDRAADAFATLLREVNIRLDGSDVITDAQASDIKALIQAIAKDRTPSGDKSGMQYRTLWSELYRRFRVPSYARIKLSQYHDVIQWLEAEQRTGA